MEKVIIRTRSPELNEFLTIWMKILFPECEIENQSGIQEETVNCIQMPLSNLVKKGFKSNGQDNGD
jgi:hypothetical protein